jgi:hypothetical protein
MDDSEHHALAKPSARTRSSITGIRPKETPTSKSSQNIACLVAIFGVLGDQLTTRIGLTIPGLHESNTITSTLMGLRLWLPIDLLLLAITIGTPTILARRCNLKNRYLSLFYPLLLGTCRLISTVWNLLLISTCTLII